MIWNIAGKILAAWAMGDRVRAGRGANSLGRTAGLRSREHRFVPIADGGSDGVGSIEDLAYALRARAPEMPPNGHQQPTIATSSNLRT